MRPSPPKVKSAKKKLTNEDELLWSCITKENLAELEKCQDVQSQVSLISEIFGFPNWNVDLFHCIQTSFYHSMYAYAKEKQFTSQEASVFIAIMKLTIDRCIEAGCKSPFIIEEFKNLVLKSFKSEELAEASGTLSLDVATLVIEYASTT